MTLNASVGNIIDRGYHLQDQLGEGGMGTVFRAVQLVSGQVVALKLVSQRLHLENPDESATSQDLHKRLELAREFQTLASLHHPNIIRVLSYGFDDRLGSYFTMEILEEPKSILESGLEQSEEAKVQLIGQLLRALAYVHRRGVIHRDIKPGNVLVVRDEVKLLDFGIATSNAGVSDIAGTLDYMAPELLLGAPPSTRSDLYAVGVIFHQLLTGTFPHSRASRTSILDSLLGEDSDRTLSPTVGLLFDSVPEGARTLLPPDADHSSLTAASAESTSESAAALPSLGSEDRPAEELATVLTGPLGSIVSKLLAREPSARYDSASTALRELAASVPYGLPFETAATRESFLQATVFVGREAELGELKAALAGLGERSGKAFLIGGESGVGKSRLISEIKTLALVQGCWVAEGQSIMEGGFLYQEWLPVFRALCFQVDLSDLEASLLKGFIPDLESLLGRAIGDPPPMKPDAALLRLAGALVAMLQRQTKPLVLIVEDLHWGRSESLALLRQVTQTAAALPLLVIGTYRSDEAPNLPTLLPDWAPMQLQRLQRVGVERLSESMLGVVGKQPQLVDYLAQQSEGNIFFLVEIVRALAEDAGELERIGQGELPENVLTMRIGRIVERRIDHVPQDYQKLLEFSAILGRKLDLAALQKVYPAAPVRDFLLTCANAAVLESHGNDWRFAHDKLREALTQRIEPERRRQIHLQVAETLESLYVGKEREQFAGALGHHYKQAGLPEKALHYFLQAGDSSTRVYAYEQARAHYAASAELLGQVPETLALRRLLVDILIKQVQYSLNSTPPEVNQQRIMRARDILDAIQSSGVAEREDTLRLARTDYYCARLHSYAGQPGQAAPLFRRVLPVAQEFNDQELVAVSSVFLGFMFLQHGQMAKSISLLQPIIEPMERLFGKDLDTLRARMFLAAALGASGRHKSALLLVEHVKPWVAEIQQAVYSGLFWMLFGYGMALAGDWPKALQAAEHALVLGKESREPIIQYLSWDVIAWSHSQLGNHQEALANRARSVEVRLSINGGMGKDWFEAAEAEIYFKAGKFEAALQQAKKVASSSQPAKLMLSLCLAKRIWGAALARLGGDPLEVDTHYSDSLATATETGMVVNAIWTELSWGQACKERGALDAAAHHFRQLQGYLTEDLTPYLREEVLRFQ